MKFYINDFFSKYVQICRSHLLQKSLMENFVLCAERKFSAKKWKAEDRLFFS